jgi:hypothetical protein
VEGFPDSLDIVHSKSGVFIHVLETVVSEKWLTMLKNGENWPKNQSHQKKGSNILAHIYFLVDPMGPMGSTRSYPICDKMLELWKPSKSCIDIETEDILQKCVESHQNCDF